MGAQQGEAGHRQKGGHHGSGGQPGQHRGKKAEKQRCAAVGQGVIKIAGRPLIQKLKKIQPGRKITIFVPRKLTQDNKDRYRVVKGEVAAI